MLILPLHRPLTRANFPIVTTVILLINLLVFFGLQAGDRGRWMQAWTYYKNSGMAEIEAPLYREHLRSLDETEARADQNPEEAEMWAEFMRLSAASDEDFRVRLERGELFASRVEYQRWLPFNTQFRQLDRKSFTERFVLRTDEPTAAALIVAVFMHGSLGHLVGNMLFLVIFGFLVEGAIGRWRFLALYLAAGLGGDAAHLAMYYGQPGGALGASGAIAGLMGAVSILWGLRKIRVFWWFGIFFDYIRIPAICLFPFWLGWEILQLVLYPNSGVGYAAHAGGLVTGGLLAWLARRRGWIREEALLEETDVAAQDPVLQVLDQAQRLIGEGRATEAERLLAPLTSQFPERLDLALCRFRAAQSARAPLSVRLLRAEAVLAAAGADPGSVREKWRVLSSLGADQQQLSAPNRAQLAEALIRINEGTEAIQLLRSLPPDPALALPARWLRMAHALQERRQPELAERALTALLNAHAEAPEAAKARFLLEQRGLS